MFAFLPYVTWSQTSHWDVSKLLQSSVYIWCQTHIFPLIFTAAGARCNVRPHTPANLDTEMCVAAGCLINWAQLFAGAFFLEKSPGVLPYTTCTEPLPSFKIAAINQKDFKGYNAQFHGRLFQLPANVIPISLPHLLHFFSSIRPSHFDSSTICPLAHSHWPTFLSLRDNAAQTAQSFSRWWGRSTLKDPEREVLSSDKHYLNLRGGSLVLDSPDNRGL